MLCVLDLLARACKYAKCKHRCLENKCLHTHVNSLVYLTVVYHYIYNIIPLPHSMSRIIFTCAENCSVLFTHASCVPHAMAPRKDVSFTNIQHTYNIHLSLIHIIYYSLVKRVRCGTGELLFHVSMCTKMCV